MSSLSEVIGTVKAVLGSDDGQWSFQVLKPYVEETKECPSPNGLQRWHDDKLNWMREGNDPDLELYLELFRAIHEPLKKATRKIEDLRRWARGRSSDSETGQKLLQEILKYEIRALRAFVRVADHPGLMQSSGSGIVLQYLKMTMDITKDCLRVIYPYGSADWLDYWDDYQRDTGYRQFTFNHEEPLLSDYFSNNAAQ
ncbi:hypothetical protein PVAG01_08721 [Phlyctema vagabunda]|uniref:Uncharacterized protein n=1 Tax=Phlyctema vagabunda TaxID=108571 RepID=A0ABR4PAD6_9HELO